MLKPVPSCFALMNWCHECRTTSCQFPTDNSCSAICSLCQRQCCLKETESTVFCMNCNRTFHGRACLDYHKLLGGKGFLGARKSICTYLCPVQSFVFASYSCRRRGKLLWRITLESVPTCKMQYSDLHRLCNLSRTQRVANLKDLQR